MKVLVLTEYYPRASDPVLGVWAHRQALATRAAGADLRVLVLHRPVPPLRALRSGNLKAALAPLRQPHATELDGLEVSYLRYLSPPRPRAYGSWGAWAAPGLALALARLRRRFAFELIHAHYAVPAGDAARRAAPTVPLVVSVHGHDVQGQDAGGANVRFTLAHASLVLANSSGTARRCRELGARETRVVHLGADLPAGQEVRPGDPVLVTVAHLTARKRHEDVIAALARVAKGHPRLRYVIVGDGPERARLEALAASLGIAERVEFRGALPHEQALATARGATLFVMPSVEEAFGVAYIEAMAGGVPAIGCRGEDGPEEIAAAGPGIELVAPRDPEGLAAAIERLLRDPARLETLSRQSRETVEQAFTWQRCGQDTVAAYREVLQS